jgi:hypothetical protein
MKEGERRVWIAKRGEKGTHQTSIVRASKDAGHARSCTGAAALPLPLLLAAAGWWS